MQLRGEYDRIVASDVGLVAVGTGGRRYAADFVEQFEIPFPVLLDTEAEAAGIVDVRSGVASVAGPRSVLGGIKAAVGGHRQGPTGPRPMQQGATLVIGQGGEVLYTHLDRDPGDHAPLDDVLEAAGVS